MAAVDDYSMAQGGIWEARFRIRYGSSRICLCSCCGGSGSSAIQAGTFGFCFLTVKGSTVAFELSSSISKLSPCEEFVSVVWLRVRRLIRYGSCPEGILESEFCSGWMPLTLDDSKAAQWAEGDLAAVPIEALGVSLLILKGFGSGGTESPVSTVAVSTSSRSILGGSIAHAPLEVRFRIW